LKWIEDFLDLSKTGNFTQTAENRCVTQPALSRRIKQLEEWVGKSLFDRNAKPIRLTAEGELLKPAAEDVLRQARALRARSGPTGRKRNVDTLLGTATGSPAPAQTGQKAPASFDVERGPRRLSANAPANIVLVDDSPISVSVLTGLIERMGYQATGLQSAREALDVVLSSPADLLLTDCEMPGFDGYALTQAIREAERDGRRRTPIVAITAHTGLEEICHCFDVGMDDYLGKPVGRTELQVVLDRWLATFETVEGIEYTRFAATATDDVRRNGDSARLVRSFCAAAHAQVERIAKLVDDGEASGVAAMLLGLKSEAYMIGAYSFGRTCGQLEKATATEDLALMLEKRGPFLASFVRLERAVRLPS
jgi:CheY-like chemotaxis protein